jgi:hypothetical protein
MKHLLVSVYQVCSNKSPGVKIGPAPGVIVFNYMCIVKLKKSSFKKPNELELKMFSMKHLLMGVYQVCPKIGPAGGREEPIYR